MIPGLTVNTELINTKKATPAKIKSWLYSDNQSYDQFNVLFDLMRSIRQPRVFFEPKNPLIGRAESEKKVDKDCKWFGYYQPHVSLARRASSAPVLCPTPDLTNVKELPAYSYKTLLCSVVTPRVELLSVRQRRWLDLLGLKPVPIDGDSSVTNLFKNEYTLLWRLNVFTSAHPVKLLAFPVEDMPYYTDSLYQKYDNEFLIMPYFNFDDSHAVTAEYMTYLTPNGLSQKTTDSIQYKALAENYTDIIKRYERCHQLKGIVNAFMLCFDDYSDNPQKINPFNIRFSYSNDISDDEYSAADDAPPRNEQAKKIRSQKLTGMLYGKSGVYEVCLPKQIEEKSGNSSIPVITKFFIAGLHSGMLPIDENTQLHLIESLIFDTSSETKYLLDYNANQYSAFLNDVGTDDKLLPLYLRLTFNKEPNREHNQLISQLLNSTTPLSIINEYHSPNHDA